jgi:hypothetical protein
MCIMWIVCICYHQQEFLTIVIMLTFCDCDILLYSTQQNLYDLIAG